MKNLSLLLLLSVIIISCSSPLDKAYKQDTLEEDIVALKESISEGELTTLAGYIALKTFSGDDMLGKTYNDLLNEATKMQEDLKLQQEEEKKLAEKARIEEAEKIKRLGDALTVSFFDKGFSEYNYQEYITYKFVFENKTEKTMKAFTGEIKITDLFDKEIKSFSLTYDDGVPPNSTKNWDAQTDFNQFIDEDVRLKNKDIEDLKIIWIPEKIIFSDNTTLE